MTPRHIFAKDCERYETHKVFSGGLPDRFGKPCRAQADARKH
jgi:hypothetical protein